MGSVIDTSVIIAAERSGRSLATILAKYPPQTIAISVITVSELLHGVARATPGRRRDDRSAFVERLISSVPIMEISLEVARVHAYLWADLASRGEIIGPHDLWIGATALSEGLSMLTANAREFERIPGLNVLPFEIA